MCKFRRIAVIAFTALLFAAVPPLPAEDGTDSKDEEKEKKAIQVYEVEVTEQAKRDEVETPNMTVLLPEFFPLGIGTSLDMVLERQAGIDVQRIQQIGTAIRRFDQAARLRRPADRRGPRRQAGEHLRSGRGLLHRLDADPAQQRRAHRDRQGG